MSTEFKTKKQRVNKIRVADSNPRIHSDRQIDLLVGGIKKFGFTIPVLVDESGQLIAGHARHEAAKRTGLQFIPTVVATGWTAAEKQAYLLADNRLAELGSWDQTALAAELIDLRGRGVDIDHLGFDEAQLLRLGATGADGEPPAATTDTKPPVDTTGEVYTLGEHRIVIAKPTDTRAILEALPDKPELMIAQADPADPADWTAYAGGVIYLWTDAADLEPVTAAIAAAGYDFKGQVVWVRSKATGGEHYPNRVSIGFLCSRPGARLNWRGGRQQLTVWNPLFGEGIGIAPIEARRRCITNHTERGAWIYDPHGGDGATLLAAEAEQRRAFIVVSNKRTAEQVIDEWQRRNRR